MTLDDPLDLIDRLAAQLRPVVSADWGMVGIYRGGVWVAERLHEALGLPMPIGSIESSFHRDDVGRFALEGRLRSSEIPFDVESRRILLVDDVLYTGRTLRAALNELFDYGRPARVDAVVLVDRGGRELPISARYVGLSLDLPASERLVMNPGPDGRMVLRRVPI